MDQKNIPEFKVSEKVSFTRTDNLLVKPKGVATVRALEWDKLQRCWVYNLEGEGVERGKWYVEGVLDFE
jgi:hypothetical protein